MVDEDDRGRVYEGIYIYIYIYVSVLMFLGVSGLEFQVWERSMLPPIVENRTENKIEHEVDYFFRFFLSLGFTFRV